MSRVQRGGFTLIELLVVVVIIGILASIGVGAYNQAMDRSRNGGVTSNVRAILLGIEQWKTDHPGLPSELVGDDPNLHLAAGDGVNPDTFPMKYVPGGRLPVSPWTRMPQTGIGGSPFNATVGATAVGDNTVDAFPSTLPLENDNEKYNLSGGFFSDGGPPDGAPPPPGAPPSERQHYGYVYYVGSTAAGRYAVFGVGKNKKSPDVVAVRANFQ